MKDTRHIDTVVAYIQAKRDMLSMWELRFFTTNQLEQPQINSNVNYNFSNSQLAVYSYFLTMLTSRDERPLNIDDEWAKPIYICGTPGSGKSFLLERIVNKLF